MARTRPTIHIHKACVANIVLGHRLVQIMRMYDIANVGHGLGIGTAPMLKKIKISYAVMDWLCKTSPLAIRSHFLLISDTKLLQFEIVILANANKETHEDGTDF